MDVEQLALPPSKGILPIAKAMSMGREDFAGVAKIVSGWLSKVISIFCFLYLANSQGAKQCSSATVTDCTDTRNHPGRSIGCRVFAGAVNIVHESVLVN